MSDQTPATPIVAQKAPYGVEVEAGKTYYWCTCGRSAKQPFCDGTHKGLHPRADSEGLVLWLQGHYKIPIV